MKNPDKDIRIAIINKLNGVVSVPVRDMTAWPNDTAPYVLITTQSATANDTKCDYGTNSTVEMHVVGKSYAIANRAEVDDIANKIMQSIIKYPYFTISGWQVIQISLDNLTDFTTGNENGISTHKIIRLRLLIRQD